MFTRLAWKSKSTTNTFAAASLVLGSVFAGMYLGILYAGFSHDSISAVIGALIGLVIGGILRLIIVSHTHDLNFFENRYSR